MTQKTYKIRTQFFRAQVTVHRTPKEARNIPVFGDSFYEITLKRDSPIPLDLLNFNLTLPPNIFMRVEPTISVRALRSPRSLCPYMKIYAQNYGKSSGVSSLRYISGKTRSVNSWNCSLILYFSASAPSILSCGSAVPCPYTRSNDSH